MAITFGEAKRLLAKYASRGGKCANSKDADLFVKQVLQYLLYQGENGFLRKFCFNACKGFVTAPYELETPVKVKVESSPGTVFGKWVEFHSYDEPEGCIPAGNILSEEANQYPTINDLPAGGARVGVFGTAQELPDATVIVQGTDTSGRDIITNHNGKQIHGELLRIIRGQLRYTQVMFGSITSIVKPKTNGYVQLLWVKPEIGQKGFLSEYSPLEEIPRYRRFKLTTRCDGTQKITILGRIRLRENYADSDPIPFDNTLALSWAAQQINAIDNDKVDIAGAKKQFLDDVLLKENEHKRGPISQPMEMYFHTSAGSIKNIV